VWDDWVGVGLVVFFIFGCEDCCEVYGDFLRCWEGVWLGVEDECECEIEDG